MTRLQIRTALMAMAAVPAAGGASAQLALSWSDGVLGASARFEVGGEPGTPFLLVPSFSDGPTRLGSGLPDLVVGTDLLLLATPGVIQQGSPARVTYPLPASSALSGMVLRAQALGVGGEGGVVTSNVSRFVLTLPGETHAALSKNVVQREHATATLLDDGRVLVAGGEVPGTGIPLRSVELFLPETQSFTPGAGALPVARSRHASSLLADGRVLLSGGLGVDGQPLASTTLFDPTTGTSVPSGEMRSGRFGHSATVLDDGRVLVVGGFGDPAAPTVELFDPRSEQWDSKPDLSFGLVGHQATRLSDGRVLVSGGVELRGGGEPRVTERAYLYDPRLDQLVPTAPLPVPTSFHSQTNAVGGGAIVVGGEDFDGAHRSTWFFDPRGESWRGGPGIVPLNDGRVVCVCKRLEVPGIPTPEGTFAVFEICFYIVRTKVTKQPGQGERFPPLRGPGPLVQEGAHTTGVQSAQTSTGSTLWRLDAGGEAWVPVGTVHELGIGDSMTPVHDEGRLLFAGSGAWSELFTLPPVSSARLRAAEDAPGGFR